MSKTLTDHESVERWLNRTENGAKVAVLLTILALLVLGVLTARGLFADGAYFFFQILQRKSFFDFDEPRLFAQLINQAPVVLALNLDIHNLDALIRLHSFGLIGLPLIFWLAALLTSWRNGFFWHFSLAFAVSYLSSGFFAVGEYNIAYSLSALALAIILKEDIGPLSALLLLAISVTLTRCYESLLFIGPILFSASLYRAHLGRKITQAARIALGISAFFFAIAAGISAWSILFPRDPANLAGAENIETVVTHKLFLCLLISTILCSALLIRRLRPIFPILCAFTVAACAIFISHPNWGGSPTESYNIRVIAGLLLSWIMLLTSATYFNMGDESPAINFYSAASIFCVTLTLCTPLVRQSWGFDRWAARLEASVLQIKTDTPISQFYGNKNSSPYDWGWTTPWLSAILKGSTHGIFLADKNHKLGNSPPEESWKIFDAYKKTAPLF